MSQKEQTSSVAKPARLMQAAAEDFRMILAIVEAEAKAMAAAQTRFAAKTSRRANTAE